MFKSITKAELLGALLDVPDDGVVAFSSNYGDRGRTEQVHELRGDVNEASIRESAYSVSGYAVNDETDGEGHDDAGADEVASVWIIS